MADLFAILIAECHSALAAIQSTNATNAAAVADLSNRLATIEATIKAQTSPSDADKKLWASMLAVLLYEIQNTAIDGPLDPQSEMHKAFASNRRIHSIGAWAVLGTAGLLAYIVLGAVNYVDCGMPRDVACALPLIACMGALGGFLTSIQSFGRYVGNRQFLKSWTLYYYLFPLKGAGLALIVFFLSHTDIGRREMDSGATVAPAKTNAVVVAPLLSTNKTTNAEGIVVTTVATNIPATRIDLVTTPASDAKKPNLVLACLIAALTGLFANQAIEMLGSVFSVIFKRVEGKDSYRDNSTVRPPTPPTKPAA